MHRPFSRLSAVSVVIVAAVVAAMALSAGRGRSARFQLHAAQWEVAFRNGSLWLDNAPQREVERARFHARSEHLLDQLERQIESAHQKLEAQPWGSAAYRAALAERNRVGDADRKLRARNYESEPGTTPAVTHSLRLLALLVAATVAPMFWLLVQLFVWLRYRGGVAVVSAFSTPVTIASSILLAAIPGLWAWSYHAALISPFPRAMPGWRIVCSRGQVWFDNQPACDETYRMYSNFENEVNSRTLTLAVNQFNASSDLARLSRDLPLYDERLREIQQMYQKILTIRQRSNVAMHITGFWKPPVVRRRLPPLWVLSFLPLIPLSLRSASMLRRSRRRSGNLCVACGYDLRATPLRCPECGAVAALNVETPGCATPSAPRPMRRKPPPQASPGVPGEGAGSRP